jgi:hypothetical protein
MRQNDLGRLEILAHLRPAEAWFWQTQGGAELALLAISGGQRLGFEMKLSESPRTTKSMRTAIHDLRLDPTSTSSIPTNSALPWTTASPPCPPWKSRRWPHPPPERTLRLRA